MEKSVTVFAPATVANVGPGFDVLGLALEQPGDEITISLHDQPGISISDITGAELSTDPKVNVVGVTIRAMLD